MPVMFARMLNPEQQEQARAEAKATIEMVEAGVSQLRLQNGTGYEKLLRTQAKSRSKHAKGCAHCATTGFDPANCPTAWAIEEGQNRFLKSI